MILPEIHGHFNQPDFFIYSAADSKYFEMFGKQFVNSIKHNTNYGIHIHLYNPTDLQLKYCSTIEKLTYTFEYTTIEQFKNCIDFWNSDVGSSHQNKKETMVNFVTEFQKWYPDDNLTSWLYKTYYASVRFVRLAEIITTPKRFINFDIDVLVRDKFDLMFDNEDVYLYINHVGQPLAGSIFYPAKQKTLEFINELGKKIKDEVSKDNLYWFLDQDCLTEISNKYNKGYLPKDFIDFNLNDDSKIWYPKGSRKTLHKFTTEGLKYL